MSPYVRPPTVEHGDRRAALSVFLILLAVYSATFTGLPDNPDAEVEFQTTRSLARDASFALGDTPEARAIVASGFHVVPGSEPGPAGEPRYYSWHGVGQALVGVPFYALGALVGQAFPRIEARHVLSKRHGHPRSEYFAHLFVGWRNPLLGAWTACLVVLTARRLKARRGVAWLTGLGYGLCTFAWPQARSTLSDVQATFFAFLAMHQLVLVREAFLGLRSPRLVHLAVLGGALAAAVLTRVALVPVACVLSCATLWVLLAGRSALAVSAAVQRLLLRPALGYWLAAFALPLAAGAALFLGTNHARFGAPLETGYGAVLASGTFFSYPPWLGLAGLLLSPGKGLAWMAPGLLLFPVGFVWARRKRNVVWPWTTLCVALACIAPVACMQAWTGAYTFGPRYVLPLVPSAWLCVGYVLGGPRPARLVVHALLLFGFVVQLPAALVDYRTHLDLAVQAARVRWPAGPDSNWATPLEADEARFLAMHWDWGFAAPWSHWRILRQRLAGRGEEFPVRDLFLMDSDLVVTPLERRERGFEHLAWVDFERRLGGRAGPAWLACAVLLLVGGLWAVRSLDPRSGAARPRGP
jgi:hypothetical protein